MAQELEAWMDRLAAKLREDLQSVETAAADKLVGNVVELLVTVDGAHCEIVAVRSKRKHAHVAVFCEKQEAATRLAQLLGFAYRGISRFKNTERKFVHRIERVAKSLASRWTKQMDAYPAAAVAKIGEAFGADAHPMLGRGYHVDVAGKSDDHDKHRYDPFYAVSIPVAGRRRALVWDQRKQQFVGPASLTSQLDPALVAAAGIASADNQNESVIGDIALEATGEVCCELPSWIALDSLPDLGACIPDCGSFDMPDCDIGGCDL